MKGILSACKWVKRIYLPLICGILCLAACGNQGTVADAKTADEPVLSSQEVAKQRAADIRMPEASGVSVLTKGGVTIDTSNTANGYVMVRYDAGGARRKVILQNGALSSTYELPADGEYAVYPLQHGDGDYQLTVYENVDANLYTPVVAVPIPVTLESEFDPYLYPNQYINYAPGDDAVLESFLQVEADAPASDAVQTLYRFVTRRIAYDYDKAASVGTGYLPDPDETLATGKGICFDYSALLATMLRVQEVPTQLVIGYVAPENAYHAWNKAYYNGEWVWMDATFDGQRKESAYADERWY